MQENQIGLQTDLLLCQDGADFPKTLIMKMLKTSNDCTFQSTEKVTRELRQVGKGVSGRLIWTPLVRRSSGFATNRYYWLGRVTSGKYELLEELRLHVLHLWKETR